MRLDEVAEREHHARAARERDVAPGLERAAGGLRPRRRRRRPRRAAPRPAAGRWRGPTPARCGSSRRWSPRPPIRWWMVFSAVVLTGSPLSRACSGSSAGCACRARTRSRAARVVSSSDTSATGTSHHASELGRAHERVGLDVHDGRAARRGARRRSAASSSSIGRTRTTSAPRLAALAARSTGSVRSVPRVAVAGAEALRADGLRERADRLVAVVLDEDDRQLDALRDGGDELLGHHQIGAVADHHEHLALGRGHLDAEPAGDLVAHAREAVLDVVALRVARAPQLVQVAGHATRPRRPRRRVGSDDAVDGADHLALGGQRAVAEPCRRARPTSSQAAASSRARSRCSSGTEQPSSASASASSPSRASATSGSPACLNASTGATLRLTNRVRRAEQAARGGREVAPAGADAEHHVGLARQRVRRGRAGRADRADAAAGGRRAASPCRPASRRPGCRSPRRARAARRSPRRRSCRRPRRSAGARAPRSSAAASASGAGSGSGRRTCQTRRSNSSSGQSNASACTSWGSASVTAPVSAGSVSTRIAASSARRELLGPLDPVPVPRDRPERVVDRDVVGASGPRAPAAPVPARAGGEHVAGQQQHRAAG